MRPRRNAAQHRGGFRQEEIRRGGAGQQPAREAESQRRLADARLPRNQPAMMQPAGHRGMMQSGQSGLMATKMRVGARFERHGDRLGSRKVAAFLKKNGGKKFFFSGPAVPKPARSR